MPRGESREDQVDRAILEGLAERKHIFAKLLEHDRRFDRTDANHEMVVIEMRRLADAMVLTSGRIEAPRPPLDSVHDYDLEVGERTLNGTPRVYLVPADKLDALKETERKYAAIGEAERTRIAINSALMEREKQKTLERAASPVLFVTGKWLPAIILAACSAAAARLWDRIVALFH